MRSVASVFSNPYETEIFAFSCSVFRDLLQREEQLQKECRSQDKRKRKKFQLSLSRLSWPKGILSIVIQFFCDVTKFSAAGHPKNLIQFFSGKIFSYEKTQFYLNAAGLVIFFLCLLKSKVFDLLCFSHYFVVQLLSVNLSLSDL